MAMYVKQDITTDSQLIATTLAALISASTITTWYGQYVLKDGANKYICIIIYDGSA